MTAETPLEHVSFEKGLERLERLVEEMESGKLGLEEMLARFEEGSRLVKVCGEKLNEVEKKIEQLVKREDGSLETEPFAAEASSPGRS